MFHNAGPNVRKKVILKDCIGKKQKYSRQKQDNKSKRYMETFDSSTLQVIKVHGQNLAKDLQCFEQSQSFTKKE